MSARCHPRPENEAAHNRENRLQVWAAWCSACWALCQQTTVWSSFPCSHSCSLLFSACFHVRILQMKLLTHNSALNLLSFLCLLSPRCQIVSPFLSKEIYWIQQEVKGNDFPKGQGRRNIYEDRVFQSLNTAQTKINIFHTMLLDGKPRDTSKPPKSREGPVKGLEHHNPLPELRTRCATRKNYVLVCYSCERSVGSFSWHWSECLTRRSADALLKPGVISVSTYVQPRGLVILVLSCGRISGGLVHPVSRPVPSEVPVVPVSQLCPLYKTEAGICLLVSSFHQLHQSMGLNLIFTLAIQYAKIPDESLKIWCHGWFMPI